VNSLRRGLGSTSRRDIEGHRAATCIFESVSGTFGLLWSQSGVPQSQGAIYLSGHELPKLPG
jgi:hypothetical protein